MIGGAASGTRNVISGNGSYGLVIGNSGTSDNSVQGNFIGTDLTGTNALGNSFVGVALWDGATGNRIGGINHGEANIIAFNAGSGVALYDQGTTNNSIRGNSIFDNDGLGIDLVSTNDIYPYVTPNDAGDTDSGPNNLQNFPVITNSIVISGNTTVSGMLNSTPNQSFLIDMYRNSVADASGYGQGQIYVGTATANTDTSGNGTFSLTISVGLAGQYVAQPQPMPQPAIPANSARTFLPPMDRPNLSLSGCRHFRPPALPRTFRLRSVKAIASRPRPTWEPIPFRGLI